jgi:hypothetical protein
VDKKPRLRIHDPGCQGYCFGTRCKRMPRCRQCGDRTDKHMTLECHAPLQCANCLGPYQSGHENCPAKPTFTGGRWAPLKKKTRAKVRAAGALLYKQLYIQAPARYNDSEKPNRAPTRKRNYGEENGDTESIRHVNPTTAATGTVTSTTSTEEAGTVDTPISPTATPNAPQLTATSDEDDLIMLDPSSITVQTSMSATAIRAGKTATAPQRKGAVIQAYENASSRPSRVAKSKPVDYNVVRNLNRLLASAASTPLPGADGVNV